MEDDNIAILTLPYNNDLNAIYSNTNNIISIILIITQMLLMISMMLLSYLIANNGAIESNLSPSAPLLNSYAIIIYAHITVWVLIVLIHFYLRNVNYKRLRVLGYHKHHSMVSWISQCPVFVLHIANALLLLSTTLICKYEQRSDSTVEMIGNLRLKSVNILQIIISLSAAIIIPFLLKLLYHEIKFRQLKNPPDVFCVDDPQHLEHAGLSQMGMRSNRYLEDLLEKQSDLIYNLKLQNSHLRMMLFKVSQNRSNGDTSINASS